MNSIFNDLKHYSLSDIVRMAWSFFFTLVCFPGAKLVRRPISIRESLLFTLARDCLLEETVE